MKLSQYNLKYPNHLKFSQVINHIAGDDDDETYSHNITVNKQVITRDTCTQTEEGTLKEHVELVNKINDETNNPEVELSKSKDLIVYEEQMPTITDTDGKTY